MSARDKFVGIGADYWDCSDSVEQLQYDDPISALEYHLDGWLSPGCDVETILRGLDDVEVYPWHRKTIPEGEAEGLADRLLEHLQEILEEDEDYADPDGDHDIFSSATLGKHQPAFVVAVKSLIADASVWQCEPGKPVTLSPDEVLEIMRVERPDWFEPEATP